MFCERDMCQDVNGCQIEWRRRSHAGICTYCNVNPSEQPEMACCYTCNRILNPIPRNYPPIKQININEGDELYACISEIVECRII